MSRIFNSGQDIVLLEPPEPIKRFMYRCDSRFHVDSLIELYESDKPELGFIFVTGSQTEFYLVCGDNFKLLKRITVDLPNNHCRGGQSQNRIARNRDIAIQTYITKLTEFVTKFYIDQTTNKPGITDLVIVGPGDKKRELKERLDQRLTPITQLVTCDSNEEPFEILSRTQLASTQIDPLKEWKDHLSRQSGRALYGKRDIEVAIVGGLLKTLYITKTLLKGKVKKACESKGITIVEIESGNDFGDILGISWYRLSE